jgi:hypothetical protein
MAMVAGIGAMASLACGAGGQPGRRQSRPPRCCGGLPLVGLPKHASKQECEVAGVEHPAGRATKSAASASSR